MGLPVSHPPSLQYPSLSPFGTLLEHLWTLSSFLQNNVVTGDAFPPLQDRKSFSPCIYRDFHTQNPPILPLSLAISYSMGFNVLESSIEDASHWKSGP